MELDASHLASILAFNLAVMSPIVYNPPSQLRESRIMDEDETSRKPNIALFVTADHKIYSKEIPFPVARADEAIVHVKCTG
jgi:hypothetical protein